MRRKFTKTPAPTAGGTKNAAQQKQRAEAVDMMKHIAAAWDIDAEEVFGRADE